MNTRLEERPTTETPHETHFGRPRPGRTDQTPASAPATKRSHRRIAVLVTMVVAATAALAVWAITNDSSATEPAPHPAFDSPGGNSLNMPPPQSQGQVEAPAFDSPGGNSLNIPATATNATVERPTFDSPGGNSLNIAPIVRYPDAPSGFDSPGGNSLDNS